MQRLRNIMFVGTGSDVGKSVIAAAFCRIFKQDGYHPAPFKAQNMSLNSYATPDGLEIGRAQAVQAEAAGIDCHTDMNPILLKPQSDHTSQVVLNGRPAGNQSAGSYFRREGREELRREVCAAFDRLASRYNPIVMEGAGSISELNLRDVDIVNMPMALHADAAVVLVADIDRGGVFASVYGSIMLLNEEERRHMCGIIINKFRGDLSLFDSGRKILEELCHVPVLGVVPYFTDIHIEEEDSMSLAVKHSPSVALQTPSNVKIAVVLLRHISNFTDFDVLERDPRVHLYYSSNPADITEADIVILPGTKSTIDDLYHLRRNGVAEAVVKARRRGAAVLGICGGYQMMGREVCDPDHVEGEIERIPGLGLLPVTTTISGTKRTQQVEARLLLTTTSTETSKLKGYEIHMGTTTPTEAVLPLLRLDDGRDDGYYVDDRCMGTYVHGILDNADFIDMLLQPYADKLASTEHFDYQTYKQQQYDLLADHVRHYVDVPAVYRMLGRLLLLLCCWLTTSPVLAQKKEISQAKTFIKGGKPQEVEKAEALMTKLLKDSANKGNKKIYLTWYQAVQKQYEAANEKLYLRQKYDTAQFFNLIKKMYHITETLDSVDALPDKKGRIAPDYRRQHAEDMHKLRRNLYYGGTYQVRKGDFRQAYGFFETYLDADRHPLFTGYNYGKTDSLMPQAAYWATFCGYRLQQPELTLHYANQALADTARREYTLQYLCEAYRQKGDSVNYLETLRTGFEEFPEHAYFFPRLADSYTQQWRNDLVLQLTEEALQVNANNELFLLAKSVALLNLGRYDECVDVCERLIAQNDTMPEAYLNMGTVKLNQALELEQKNQPRKYRTQLRKLYTEAKPYMETYRKLAPEDKQRWAPALYRIYLNLNMGKQFEEIDRVMRN